jgi:hypothetical protein
MVSSHVHYSLVLVLVGLLYGVLSVSRKSFGFGLLAALAANGGLGFLLHDRGVSLLLHSQLWLVPAAISVLAAAYLNRDRLTKEQMITVRYFSLMAIYVSSTVDIFSNGVGEAPLLPVLLAALSLAGILAGIMLRVRAFLMCGTVFLLVALVTMIKYAAVDRHQTWLWFVSVIVLGVCILVLFAFFEKKREEVLHLVEGLKQWER